MLRPIRRDCPPACAPAGAGKISRLCINSTAASHYTATRPQTSHNTTEELFSGCTKRISLPLPHGGGAAVEVPISVPRGLRAGTTIRLLASGSDSGATAAAATTAASTSGAASAAGGWTSGFAAAAGLHSCAVGGGGGNSGGGGIHGSDSGGIAVVVREETHAVYRRVGDDLLAVVTVPLVDALTGGAATLPRLGGGAPLVVRLPEEGLARSGAVLSFAGEGMPRAGDPRRRGSLHVRVVVAFPPSLAAMSDERRAALRAALGG